MRILFVNEFTAIKGGVDTLINLEIAKLKEKGHFIELFSIYHSEIIIKSKFTFLKYLFIQKDIKRLKDKIISFNPQIIHIHNIYPLWGNFLKKLKVQPNIKIVYHIHNFYPFCINSFFFRKEQSCQLCFNKNSLYFGIKYKCYQNSYAKSFYASLLKTKSNDWLKYSSKIDSFLAVSNFIFNKYIELGIDTKKITYLKNPVTFEINNVKNIQGDYILYIGNINKAKGVDKVCLLAKELQHLRFMIVGSGEDYNELVEKYGKLNNLEFCGYLGGERKIKVIKKARFVIFPTLLKESFGLVILEAFKLGKPVLTTGLGATGELVKSNISGQIYDYNSFNDLKEKTIKMWNELNNKNVYFNNCIKKANEYNLTEHISLLEEHYNSIINK